MSGRRIAVLVWGATLAAFQASPLAGADVIESFNVARDGRMLLLPLQFEDRTCEFVLDTGSNSSFFDPEIEAYFQRTGAIAVLPEGRFYIWRSRGGAIGHRRVPLELSAVPRDMSDVRSATGQHVRGILGMDFLRAQVVQIDVGAGRVAFLTSTQGVAGKKVDIDCDRVGRPTLALDLPGSGPAQFLIDTGLCRFENGSIARETFAQLQRAGQLSAFDEAVAHPTLSAPRMPRSGLLARCTLGGHSHDNQLLIEGESNVVGLSFLSRYKLTFDFLNATLIVEPGPRHRRFAPANRLGVDVELRPGTLVFREVDEAGLAWRLGIRPGDRVVEVGGIAIAEKPAWELAHIVHLAPEGAELKVRGADESEARLITVAAVGDDGD